MMWLVRAAVILVFVLLSACAGVSQYLVGHVDEDPNRQSLDDPQNTILLIYNHGSQPEFSLDHCYPNSWTTPAVIKRLNGRQISGRTVRVYGLCSNGFLGNYNHRARQGEAKVVKRSRKIAAEIERFQAMGVPKEQIFLAGHSAGAWASLLLMSEGEAGANAVIGFSPAFAGRSDGRSLGWQRLRQQHIESLTDAGSIPALIYAVEEDEFEPADALVFLRSVDGVQLERRSARAECHSKNAHRLAFQACFANVEVDVIEDFIRQRLRVDKLP